MSGEELLMARWKRADHVVKRKIGDETLLVPVTGKLAELDKIFLIEGIGDFLWDELENRSAEELIADVTSRYDVARDVAEQDVWRFLMMLKEHGLAICENNLCNAGQEKRGG